MEVTKEDCEMQGVLTQLISQNARWNVSSSENMRLTKCFEWLNGIGDRFDQDVLQAEKAANEKKEKKLLEEESNSSTQTNSKKKTSSS